jgi:polysaccharide chain length determinant protein (PEP-CTERM system associated)
MEQDIRTVNDYTGMMQRPQFMEEDVKTLGDYVEIIKHRIWSLVLPIVIIFAAAFLVALFYPRTYRSTSTILIEEQEIPKDFVITTITGFADQRLQSINQRIMSTTKLLEVMNRFNLYADLRKKMTTEEIVDLMRKDIRFETISADMLQKDNKAMGPKRDINPLYNPTIAFTLSYDGKTPQVVEQVANVLASLYLEENLRTRERQSAGASRFLDEEAKAVQHTLIDLDAKISAFKTRNLDTLPELAQVNLQGIDRVQQELARLAEQLKSLREKEGYLQTQLTNIPTESTDQDKNLLKELKARLVSLESRYSDKYPDVRKTRMDIAVLERRIALKSPGDESSQKQAVEQQASNPAYIAIASQLASVQSDIESVKRQIVEMQEMKQIYIRRTEATPRVEETYKGLMVERANAQAKYDDLMKRVMEAKVSQGLEREQMGERFTLIDPARLPEKPIKPNVPAVLLIGLFLGIAGGVGNVSLKEYGDQSVRSPGQLALATPYPVLGTIPRLVTEMDRQRIRTKRTRILIVTGLIVVAGLLFVHFFIIDLEVAWARIARQLML